MSQTVTVTGSHPAFDQAPTLEVPSQLGPVTLIRELGRGGMGTVWLGRHDLLGRDVAVKFLLSAVAEKSDPDFAQFLSGARAASAVRHLGLTAIHHADLIGGVPYIVMECVAGPTLADVLARTGPLPIDAALAATCGVCDAVGALHDSGIIHRDIKPSNVLLDMSGQTYVTDFGLACSRLRDGSRVSGTPGYMAPEMFQGEVSPRSDVFALCVMAYELLTAELPPDAADRSRERLAGAGVDPRVIDLIDRGMSRDPLYRYKSSRHLTRALEEIVPSGAHRSTGQKMLAHLVAKSMQAETGARQQPVVVAPDSNYPDRLHELAERRRDSDPPAPPAPAPVPTPPGRLTQSVACLNCAYDLRWQQPDGKCSECGEPVQKSIGPERLIFADKSWLRRVCRGLKVLEIGLYMWTAFVLALAIAAPIAALSSQSLRQSSANSQSASTQPTGRGFMIMAMAVVVMMSVQQLVTIVGAVLSTARNPARERDGRGEWMRRWSRWGLLISVVMIVPQFFEPQITSMAPLLGRVINALGAVVITMTVAALLGYLRVLAESLPDRRLCRWFRSDMICVLACAIPIVAMMAGLSTSTFGSLLTGRRSIAQTAVVAVFGIAQFAVGLLAVFGPAVLGSRIGRLRRAVRSAVQNHVDLATLVSADVTTASPSE